MKVKKTGFIVPLVLAAVFLIIGLVVMFLPNSSPIAVSQKLETYKDSGYICFRGKIKNVTDETVTVSYMLITVSTSGGDTMGESDEVFELRAGEELDFEAEEYGWRDTVTPYNVTELKVKVNGVTYTVYESMSFKTIGAVFLYILAAIFGISAISAFVQASRRQKRYNSIEESLGKLGNNSVFMVGTYGKAGEAGKAAAKTAASVFGGIVSTIFLGAGFYKVYGVDNQHEFVLSDEGLFAGKPTKGEINLANMMFISRNAFKEFILSANKNQVVLSHKVNGDTITLNLADNKSLTAEGVVQRINALTAAAEAANTADQNAETQAPAADPFEEI